MKNLLITAVLAAVSVPALPAHAQSANDWIRYQEAVDPAYNRDRWWGYSGGGYLPLIPYYHDTEKKGGTKKEFNGRDLQYCRSSQWGPAGYIEPGQPCPVVGSQAQQVATVSYTVDNGRLVAESNQASQALSPAQQGYWEEDQDQKCYVVPSGERGVTRYCNKK